MVTGEPSIPIPMVRRIRVPGKEILVMADPSIPEWTNAEKAMYQRDGVQMVLDGPVTQRIREHVAVLFKSRFVMGAPNAEQGLVNYLFREIYIRPGHARNLVLSETDSRCRDLFRI